MADRNRVFISYSHMDAEHLKRLRVHLRPLERDHIIEVWDDTQISPGASWRDAISDALSSAQVAILLISADFLASDFIMDNELPPLLEAASSAGTTVLCVPVNPSRFNRTPQLSQFQAVNDPNRPLSVLPFAEQEAVWVRVADAVEAVFEEREAAEGWLVRNERTVFEALRTLMLEGADEAYLIVQAGGYYLQYMRAPGGQALYSEAVSNAFLPQQLQLTNNAIDLLVAAGFDEPLDEDSNFSRYDRYDDSDEELYEIASTAVRVLSDVYQVSERVSLDTRLVLKNEP